MFRECTNRWHDICGCAFAHPIQTHLQEKREVKEKGHLGASATCLACGIT